MLCQNLSWAEVTDEAFKLVHSESMEELSDTPDQPLSATMSRSTLLLSAQAFLSTGMRLGVSENLFTRECSRWVSSATWQEMPGRTGSKWTILIVFSGLESGAAARNKLGELLSLAYLCLGSKLFGVQNVSALICSRSMLFRCGLAHDTSIFDIVHDS